MDTSQRGDVNLELEPALCAGIVLAGGRSRRMGQDKAGLEWAGEPMLTRIVSAVSTRCAPVFVVAAVSSPTYRTFGNRALPVEWVTDEPERSGPLGALATALTRAAAAGCDDAFVCAIDMPLLAPELVDELRAASAESVDVVVAADAQRVHPFAGVYRTRVARTFAELAVTGERRMTAALDAVSTVRISLSRPEWLTNVNSPEDLHRLRREVRAV